MKIRIFALAKELGMDSKVLIKHCNEVGVPVKSSALASISPEERDIVVNSLKKGQGAAAATAEAAPPTPVRESHRDLERKVRDIKTMAPRSQPSLARRRAEAEAAQKSREQAATSTDEAETESPRATATETEPAEAEPTKAETESPQTAAAEAAEVTETAEEQIEQPQPSSAPTAETSKPEEKAPADEETQPEPVGKAEEPEEAAPTEAPESTKTPAAERISPIRRDDYVPASGTSGSTIREMKPRGTTSEPGRGKRSKGKPRPALPTLAAPPTYKAPKVKKPKEDEGPAQKPDLKLTAEVLEQQSPLASHLKKHSEQKRKKGTEDRKEGEGLRRGPRAGGGVGLEEGRQQRRERRKQSRVVSEEEAAARIQRTRGLRRRRQKTTGPVELKTSAQIELPITVRGLSEALGRPANDLIRVLFNQGKMVTINSNVDEETALELGLELGVDLEIKRPRDIEEELAEAIEAEETGENLESRPPIITILGHVDHGKTSLLDRIRSANVAAGEAGGITQHIASYQVEHNGQKLTFVDTPGHAAFGEMRARGANVTDIVVLVVAADDGVMPQTVECISHAKAAGVPIVVALNKIDLPDTNEQKILADLSSNAVVPAEWGGEVEVVRTSATTGQGIEDLLETLLVTAELHEFKADPDRPALGVCLEAFRDEGRGALAWLIVQKGTLRIGDIVLCGSAHGRIRAMYNDRDEEIEQAGPSTPVKIAGLDTVPGAGDHFFVMSDLDEARQAAEDRRHRGRTKVLSGRGKMRTLDDILNAARGGAVQDLPLILKADTPGSIEALRSEIEKFEHPEVRVDILHEGVGGVNESDVYLASASDAIIIAFHVIAEDRARALAEREGVEIRRYNIIYEVIDDVRRSLEGLLLPERVEVSTGRALVLQTFSISRVGTIAGCRVLSGTIERSNRVHVIRDQTVLNDYAIASLRREKDDVREVRDGMECGIRLEGFNDVKEGDLLEAFRVEEVKRTLT